MRTRHLLVLVILFLAGGRKHYNVTVLPDALPGQTSVTLVQVNF